MLYGEDPKYRAGCFRDLVFRMETRFNAHGPSYWRVSAAAGHLEEAHDDLLAFTAFPYEGWRRCWNNNPQERLNREIRRRIDVVDTLPRRTAVIGLIGAMLADQHDE